MKKHIKYLSVLLLMFVSCNVIDPDETGALVPPTTDQDYLLPQMTIGVANHQRSIHIESFGDSLNPVLLVLHGSASDYRPYLQLNKLSDKYFVVMWDQRGCGLSERITENEITWCAAIEEIDQIKNQFSPGRPVNLISHSWGGCYAALYMSEFPEKVDQAIFAEPGPSFNGRIFEKIKNRLININLAEKVYNDLAWSGEFLSAKNHQQMDYKYLMLIRGTMMNYFCSKKNIPDWPVWRMGAYVEYVRQKRVQDDENFDFSFGLKDFPREVLIIGSQCSVLGYDFQNKYHKDLFQNARVVKIQNSGHRLFTEQFDTILNEVKLYLNEFKNGK